jgi:hypothetical protein
MARFSQTAANTFEVGGGEHDTYTVKKKEDRYHISKGGVTLGTLTGGRRRSRRRSRRSKRGTRRH